MTSKPQVEKISHNDVLGVVALLDPEVCYCIPGDNASGICPCCEENYVSCGVSAPGVCVQRDVAWLCHKVRPGMIVCNCVEVFLLLRECKIPLGFGHILSASVLVSANVNEP